MSKQINLTINGNRFDVDLEDEFASYLIRKMSGDFNVDGNTTTKTLLQAYVRTSYKLYQQEKELNKILNMIDIS